MSDRLTLAHAIDDAGIERAKAERMASVIFDAIHDNVATKADIAIVSADLRRTEGSLKADIATVRAELTLIEHRLITRLGGLAAVLAGALFVALHLWPPHS